MARVLFKAEVDHRLLCFRRLLSFIISNKHFCQCRPNGGPMTTLSVCLHILLLKLNPIEEVTMFINLTNTSLEMDGWLGVGFITRGF